MAKKLTKQQREVRAMKAKLPLGKPKKRGLEHKTAQQLIKDADMWFSRYVRLRDSEFDGSGWKTECIDGCGRSGYVHSNGRWIKGFDNGHFISRGVFSLRYDELNCSAQNSHCNAWRDKEDMLEGYRNGLDMKYGSGTAQELKRLSKIPDAYKRPTKPELLQIIADCKEYIRYTLEHEVGKD